MSRNPSMLSSPIAGNQPNSSQLSSENGLLKISKSSRRKGKCNLWAEGRTHKVTKCDSASIIETSYWKPTKKQSINTRQTDWKQYANQVDRNQSNI
uniref:Uncharacterized protein n=1 Tax=Arundo donax TaxID=35708 RepID=A0A0A9DZE6_ARUDO